MKKVTIILIASALICSMGFTSCKKCTTCKITSNSVSWAPDGEYCGTPKQVSDYKDSFHDQYGLIGDVTCE